VEEYVIQLILDGAIKTDMHLRWAREYKAERREAIRKLYHKGLNDCEIRRKTGISERQVWRVRKELGLETKYDPKRDAGRPSCYL
jgi:DNA invertase Pin-like site-specific DNA recombinase